MTDAMNGLCGGKCDRYIDWIDPKSRDTRSGDEIDRELSEKFGWTEVK